MEEGAPRQVNGAGEAGRSAEPRGAGQPGLPPCASQAQVGSPAPPPPPRPCTRHGLRLDLNPGLQVVHVPWVIQSL
jgi:hypothetical protein